MGYQYILKLSNIIYGSMMQFAYYIILTYFIYEYIYIFYLIYIFHMVVYRLPNIYKIHLGKGK